ncbi:MAG TPA: hypothetical protein DCQ93_07165 [Bacteroidetes bacterium]|nr:hypothetical protein [Bacteroidota bacterium]
MLQDTSVFESRLKENELILWEGIPKQGRHVRDMDMIVVPISIIAIGFGGFFHFAIFYYQEYFFLPLGMFIVFAGIYMGIIRFFMDAARRRKLKYCVTNKRVLMFRDEKKFLTLPLKDIEQLDYTEEKDGSGYILFGTTNPMWPWLFGKFFFTRENIPGFEMIPEVQNVYLVIRNAVGNYVDPVVLEKVLPDKLDLN